MWEFNTALTWTSGKEGRLKTGNDLEIMVSTPPEFKGPAGMWSPEDLLAGAVNSCIMTTSLFFLEKSGIDLVSYTSNAAAQVDKSKEGLVVTGVALDVSIAVGDGNDVDKAYAAIHNAEKSCLISKSLKCDVSLKLSVKSPAS